MDGDTGGRGDAQHTLRAAAEGHPGLLARLQTWLASAKVPHVAAAIAFVLSLPTVGAGYFLDDRYHEYILRGGPVPGGPRGAWDLYRFAEGTDRFREALRAGWYPWWTNPDLKLAFFRPIASLWRYADFLLWGETAWVAHLETCIVYAALAFVAARAYGHLVGGAAAGLAGLGFAVDDGHNLPITWISNRYALLAALFGVGALLAHGRARSRGGSPLLGPLLLALALLSGETALGFVGYLLGYALFLDPKGRRAGLLALAPHAGVTILWSLGYRAMGYGSLGSAFYIDPLGAPKAFAIKALSRLPELALSGVLGPPAEVWAFVGTEHVAVVAAGAAVAAGAIVWFVTRAARQVEGPARDAIPALLLGAAIALIPVCGTMPDDRNFIVSGFGFFGVLGVGLTEVWRRGKSQPLMRRAGCALLVGVHFVLAPVLLPLRGLNTAAMFTRTVERGARTLPHDERIRDKKLVMVGVPDSLIIMYMLMEGLLEPGPHATVGTILSVESTGVWTAEFESDDTLVIRNPEGVLHCPFVGLYSDRPFARGEVFDRELERVEIMELNAEGEPSVIRVTLHVPKEDRAWVVWSGRGFVELPVPKTGDTLRYEGVDLMTLLQQH